MKPFRQYRTGYLIDDFAYWPSPPFKGKGWNISYAVSTYDHGVSKTSKRSSISPSGMRQKEAIINAPKFQTAQEAFELLNAALNVRNTGPLPFGELEIVKPVDKDELKEVFSGNPFDIAGETRWCSATGIPAACLTAAKASHRRATKYSLAKLKFSYDQQSIFLVDIDPHFATDHFGVSPCSTTHVKIAYALLSAYSVIEELGLEIRANAKNPSLLKDGSWNPKVRNNLEKRLIESHINLDDTFPWVRRGKPTKVEKAKELPSKGRCSWSHGPYVRDCELEVVDAIRVASFIRSKITAHKLPDIAASLTIYDLENVRNLARRLLLERLRLWKLRPGYNE